MNLQSTEVSPHFQVINFQPHTLFNVFLSDVLLGIRQDHRAHPSLFCGHDGTITRENIKADSQYADNKGFAEDLTEGKFSFPVVHGVRADTSNRQLLREYTSSPISSGIITFPLPLLPKLHNDS